MPDDAPPPPLVAADIDLSKIDGFMLDTVRLLGSELVAISTGEEFKAAVLLWARAWHQKPAASLPDDDRVLASFAMVPLQRWKKVKQVALRGFIKCSDGRLYHKVLAEDAVRAWARVTQRREAIRKRYGPRTPVPTGDPTAVDPPNPPPNNGDGYETPTVDGTGQRRDVDGDGTETGRGRDGTSPQTSPRESARALEPVPLPPLTPMTADWKPGPEIQQFAALQAIPDREIARQTALFRDHYLANGERRADWQAAFRKWLNSRGKFTNRNGPAEPQPKRSAGGYVP